MSNRQYLRRFSFKMYSDTDIFRLSKKSLSDFESSLTIKSSLTTVSSKFSSFVEEDNYDPLRNRFLNNDFEAELIIKRQDQENYSAFCYQYIPDQTSLRTFYVKTIHGKTLSIEGASSMTILELK